jgi:S-adenosylmethionine:diacylglycerol 3-amino-3-carboxypropyl transferase
MHFEKLNYSFANETTDIELSFLPENAESIFCIAGSGSRFTPLLSKNPLNIDVYDSSLAQLYLAEVRYQAICQLNYTDYLKILGYLFSSAPERMNIFLSLKLPIENKNFWLKKNLEWQKKGFIFIGAWEKKLQILRKLFYLFHFKGMNKIFSENQGHLFPEKSWNIFCRTVLTENVVKKLLYSGQSKYNLEVPFGQYIQQKLLKQIQKNDLESEFFLQFLFCGKLLSSDAWPLEASESIFEASKKSTSQVQFVHKNINEIKRFNYNFYSLSDCFSYLSDVESQNIINQIGRSSVKSSGIIRYFMYRPSVDFSQYQFVENINSGLDRVPIYKIMHYRT